MPKLVVLLGPTAAGKTEWGIRLAKKFNGEIISADSRQVYKKMNIGTAKPVGEWRWNASWKGLRRSFFADEVIHHLIDIVDPGKHFTVAEFRDLATKYVKLAYRNNRVPFIVGGTGLYISSLVDNFSIPRIPPNKKLRRSLEEKTSEELMALLQTLDPETAQKIDGKNIRRVIRALEVCILSGEPFSGQQKKGDPMFQVLQIGVEVPRDVLHKRISERIDTMAGEGIVEEVKDLLRQKYSWNLPSMSGVGYRQFQPFFEEKLSLEQCIENLKRDTRQFARRQLTWFRRDKRILWCESYEEAEKKVEKFLSE